MKNINNKEGWICPICGTVNAPWMAQCNCRIERIVRCEDCKHCEIIDYYTTRGEKYIIAYRCMMHDGFKNEDDFCSYGERKEEE